MINTAAFVNTINSAASVQGSSGDNSIKTQIQLDSSGVGYITIANADTYEVLSMTYQVAVADQSALERFNLADTTKINIQSQSAINAGANQYVNVEYILASDLS